MSNTVGNLHLHHYPYDCGRVLPEGFRVLEATEVSDSLYSRVYLMGSCSNQGKALGPYHLVGLSDGQAVHANSVMLRNFWGKEFRVKQDELLLKIETLAEAKTND